ncbi:MAG: HAD-IA family hydrolase [Thermoanaerobaculia bacterium]
MQTRRRWRLLIFDWDGTLFDSIGSIVECTLVTLREIGHPEVEIDDIRGAIGLGLRETVNLFSPGCDDSMFDRIVQVYRRHWFAKYSHEPFLFPGVEEMLAGLAEKDYLLAIATAKGRTGLLKDLDRAQLQQRFHTTRTVDESPSKPSPQMLLDIMDELGVAPRQSLMIGDTTHDLQMAGNAGVEAVAVCSGSQSRERLLGEGPIVCLKGVADLGPWLLSQQEVTRAESIYRP